MTSNEEKVKEPRSISKAAFEFLVFGMLIVLTIGETAVAVPVSRVLGSRLDGDWFGGLTVVNLVLARLAVDGILRWFGLSRSGKTLEVRGRTVAFAEGEVADDEVVEVHFPKSLIRFLLGSCLLGCVLFAVMATLTPRSEPWLRALAFLLSGFSALGALNIWWDRKPQAWADQDGVTGYPIGFYLSRRFVPWANVAGCEIETFHNTFGEPIIIRPVLKGWNGESLMTLNLLYTTMEDQDRLVKSIKARLPKLKDDFWE